VTAILPARPVRLARLCPSTGSAARSPAGKPDRAEL